VFDLFKRDAKRVAYRAIGMEPPYRTTISHDQVDSMVHALLKDSNLRASDSAEKLREAEPAVSRGGFLRLADTAGACYHWRHDNTELLSSRAMDIGQTNENSQESRLTPWVLAVAAAYLVMHLLTATRYGYFRDARIPGVFAASGLGYVDQPPLIVALAWMARHTLGTSLRALLFWPALAGAARIVLTAAFARELGAKRWARCWPPMHPRRRPCGTYSIINSR